MTLFQFPECPFEDNIITTRKYKSNSPYVMTEIIFIHVR